VVSADGGSIIGAILFFVTLLSGLVKAGVLLPDTGLEGLILCSFLFSLPRACGQRFIVVLVELSPLLVVVELVVMLLLLVVAAVELEDSDMDTAELALPLVVLLQSFLRLSNFDLGLDAVEESRDLGLDLPLGGFGFDFVCSISFLARVSTRVCAEPSSSSSLLPEESPLSISDSTLGGQP